MNDLSDKEFFKKVIVIMLTQLGRRMDKHSESFNRDRKHFKSMKQKSESGKIQ